MGAKPRAAVGWALGAGLASVVLVTLAAAPWKQSYLAWFGLAPWLVAVGRAPRVRSAVLFGCWTGWLYFALNLWWLWTATIPGTIGLILYFGVYWGLAAGLIHYLRLAAEEGPVPPVVVQVVGTAVVWVAAEWLRCNLLSGFPWLPIGTTQAPLIVMCQIADWGGIWAVSFWVVMANALVAAWWRYRREPKRLWLATLVAAIVLVSVAAYGGWRLSTTARRPGPRVMVIQSNHPHLRGGASTTTPERAAEFFLNEMGPRLSEERIDLVILPENEFPPLNDEARSELASSRVGPFLDRTHRQLAAIARDRRTAILVGGAAVAGWKTEGKEHIGTEIYNSAYLYDPWNESAVRRYDKIYLVPFSERVPFASASAWLRRIAMYLAANRAVQPLRSGTMREFAPFILAWSDREAEPGGGAATRRNEAAFVSPICLENIDPAVVTEMVWDSARSQKRADFIANLSNDGWFHTQEKHQHLQNLAFRCIENRVPMARSSNTGISGFVDSTGRIRGLLPVDKSGALTSTMELDDRVTFYTRHGDIFAWSCLAAVGVGIVVRAVSICWNKAG